MIAYDFLSYTANCNSCSKLEEDSRPTALKIFKVFFRSYLTIEKSEINFELIRHSASKNFVCIESGLYASIEYKHIRVIESLKPSVLFESSKTIAYHKMGRKQTVKNKRTREISKESRSMRVKLFIFLILITLPVIASPQKKDFIGYKHKGVLYGEILSNGAKDLGGGLLSNADYGVTRLTKDKKYMLWLEKITHRDAKGVPSWQVKDVLMFDDLKKNQEFLFSYSSGCLQNGRKNLDLIVMAERLPAKKTYKVIRAWRANVKKEKFEKISDKGIVCQYVEH